MLLHKLHKTFVSELINQEFSWCVKWRGQGFSPVVRNKNKNFKIEK